MSDKLNPNISKPRYCVISITLQCFMKCKMCYLWKNKNINEHMPPSIEDWTIFLESLRDLIQGSIEINFSGGEPFLEHGKLLELIKVSHNLGFITSVISNGYFIDEVMSKKIKESGLKRIILSLDSLDEEKHDALRGKQGSFARAIEAIRVLRSENENLEIGIQTIIMQPNLDDIIPLVYWTKDRNDLNFIRFQAVIQPIGEPVLKEHWYLQDAYKHLWPQELRKLYRVLDLLIKLRTNDKTNVYKIANLPSQLKIYKAYFKNPYRFIKRTKICDAIDSVVNITEDGQVFLCWFMDSIGDIKQSFVNLWYSDRANDARKKIALCKKNCNFLLNCNYED